MMDFMVVVPWHRDEEIAAFMNAWGLKGLAPDWLILQQDKDLEGCAVTKNRGIARAMVRGADVVVVLDGDCYPTVSPLSEGRSMIAFAERHIAALEPQPVKRFRVVTDPPSRGTPYAKLSLDMPVAASMGFWTLNGDHCAVRQLATNNAHMTHDPSPVFADYFPLCGMNLAFRPAEWSPWCEFIEVERFDDIWQGWLWQKEAYRRGHCFNLGGPLVRHSRQSNVWKNLRAEVEHLEASEHLWRKIAKHESSDYATLRKLLPV